MRKLPRISKAEPVIDGVLKIGFDDGYVGVVDLRPLIGKGKVFAWLAAPENFALIQIDEFGHSISWRDDTGYTIDLSADSLRRDAERQAQIHQLMATG